MLPQSVEASLALPPFSLAPDDLAWVRKTLDGLDTEARLRQLFVHIGIGDNAADMAKLAAWRAGGLHRFCGPDLTSAWQATRAALEAAAQAGAPPLIITGDIEGGGHLSPVFTGIPNPLGMAAIGDPAFSARVYGVLAAEARALGFDWSFTPCIDVNAAHQSAIVGTRSYGATVDTILAQARAHMAAMQGSGIAVCAKHWPGEGFDERDQHLVTTVNPLPVDGWMEIFGKLYGGLIADGLLTVMSAHIAHPALAEKFGVPAGLERYRPASISRVMNQDVLRGMLGFNGLIISDATPMAGLGSWGPRSETAPAVIESGCDVFLFAEDPDADLEHLRRGLKEGRLSEQRLNDAVMRFLGLKAKLGLHKKTLDQRLPPLEEVRATVGSAEHKAVAAEAAGRSITLVKNVAGPLTGQGLVPLDPAKHKRLTLADRGAPSVFPGVPRKPMTVFAETLAAHGFVVTPMVDGLVNGAMPGPDNTDVLIYVQATESSLGLSRIYFDWWHEQPGLKQLMTRHWHTVPALLVSFGNPYYLSDMPRIPAAINAYATIPSVQAATALRLIGKAPFAGSNPVNPFAGAPEAQY